MVILQDISEKEQDVNSIKCPFVKTDFIYELHYHILRATVVPTKSDSDDMFVYNC